MCPEEEVGPYKKKEVKRIKQVNITHLDPPPCKPRTQARVKCLGTERECCERQPIGNATSSEGSPKACGCKSKTHRRLEHLKTTETATEPQNRPPVDTRTPPSPGV